MNSELEKNRSGNVVIKPIIGWEIAPVAEIALLLVVRYAESPEEFQRGGKSVQFGLTPQQALQLAEALTKTGKSLIEPQAGKSLH